MATCTRTTGYECEFVGNPLRSQQFRCSICLQVLREPYQAICCGEVFCKECIHRVKAANEPCPICRDKDFPSFPDKALQRDLYNFRVYCTYRSEGCGWIGELRELDNHLNLKCLYPLLAEWEKEYHEYRYYRLHAGGDEKAHTGGMPKDIKAHGGDKVKFRAKTKQTEFAGLSSQFETLMFGSKSPQRFVQPQQPGTHVTSTSKPVCAEFTTNLDEYKSDNCTWYTKPVVAKYTSDRHFYTHPRPVGAEYKSDRHPRAKFTMTNFDKYKSDNDIWYSPRFYTHPYGYKMCLQVHANGSASGRGTHLSVFVCLMQGEFDDQLEWPFQRDITVKVVDQKKDRDHVVHTFYSGKAPSERCERVMTKERTNNGWGIGQFLSHDELQPEYLMDDCIKFNIKKL